jgi:hypothetical protein
MFVVKLCTVHDSISCLAYIHRWCTDLLYNHNPFTPVLMPLYTLHLGLGPKCDRKLSVLGDIRVDLVRKYIAILLHPLIRYPLFA